MQGSESTVNPQQGVSGLQSTPEQQLQPTGEGSGQASTSASAVLQSPATSQQTQLFLRGETAGQKVSGDGEWMPPAVSAVLIVLLGVILVLLIGLLVQRFSRRHTH